MITRFALTAAALAIYMCGVDDNPGPANFDVVARAETEPSNADLDDIAIWRAPGYANESLLVATDRSGGLLLYALDGKLRQTVHDGVMNNVDLRTDVELGGEWGIGTLIATSNRTDDTIDLYTIDPGTLLLSRLAAFPSVIGEPYGLCIHRSAIDGRIYVVANDQLGLLAQYQYSSAGTEPTLQHVRTVTFGGPIEGCVADDELARLYVSEEDLGIWRLGAEPTDSGAPVLIDDTEEADGHLTADVEGLTIYYAANGAGYLIASNQGTSTFVIYERGGDNKYLTHFRIAAGALDAAVQSDGIDVSNLPLGSAWPNGLFIAQDDVNEDFTSNFKLVDWGDIVAASDVALLLDSGYSLD